MSGEHNTPVGTPVVIAPGKVFVVGEYAVLEEGSAVQAAIARYAKAQFVPRMDTMPPLIADVVDRMKAELGEVAAALPPGGVLVTTDDFRLDKQVGGLGSSAAMAVASAGAVLECLGLSIESRKQQIHRVSDAARRATQGNVGSGADTAAAAYGGLIRITRPKGKPIEIVPMMPPAGLHVVLFSGGPSIPSRKVVEGIQSLAKKAPAPFGVAMAELRETAQRFVEGVERGDCAAAIAAAGSYGERLQRLCDDAGVSIMTEPFVRAAGLAHEFGGIAKPTGAGGGEIGVALFATAEAARWFRKACTEPLAVFDGDLDPLGVRCQFADATVAADLDERDSAATPSPEPDEVSLPPVNIARVEEEVNEAVAVNHPEEATGAMSLPITEEMMRGHSRKWVIPVLALALVLALIVGITLAQGRSSRHREDTVAPAPVSGGAAPTAAAAGAAPVPADSKPSLAAPSTAPVTKEHSERDEKSPAQEGSHPSVSRTARHGHRIVGARAGRYGADTIDEPAVTSPGVPQSLPPPPPRASRPSKAPAHRAGTLTPADF